jgi:hypothetical protein
MHALNGHTAFLPILRQWVADLLHPGEPFGAPAPSGAHDKSPLDPGVITVVEQPASELATMLSPSQVRTFMDCQMHWYYKHVLWLPDPANANLSLGKAVHAALAANFTAKLEGGKDLPAAEVLDLFRCHWNVAASETEFRDDDNPVAIGAQGEQMVEKYMREAAPLIEPAAVELPVEGTIASVKVQGRLDLVEKNGRVRDIKTTTRKSGSVTGEHAFQLATYTRLCPLASGDVAIDQLVRTKTVQLATLPYHVKATDEQACESLYPLAQQMMRSQNYMPNRCSNLCSRKNCAFWRRCERDFGGTVEQS